MTITLTRDEEKFELEERLGTRILERLYSEASQGGDADSTEPAPSTAAAAAK